MYVYYLSRPPYGVYDHNQGIYWFLRALENKCGWEHIISVENIFDEKKFPLGKSKINRKDLKRLFYVARVLTYKKYLATQAKESKKLCPVGGKNCGKNWVERIEYFETNIKEAKAQLSEIEIYKAHKYIEFLESRWVKNIWDLLEKRKTPSCIAESIRENNKKKLQYAKEALGL